MGKPENAVLSRHKYFNRENLVGGEGVLCRAAPIFAVRVEERARAAFRP